MVKVRKIRRTSIGFDFFDKIFHHWWRIFFVSWLEEIGWDSCWSLLQIFSSYNLLGSILQGYANVLPPFIISGSLSLSIHFGHEKCLWWLTQTIWQYPHDRRTRHRLWGYCPNDRMGVSSLPFWASTWRHSLRIRWFKEKKWWITYDGPQHMLSEAQFFHHSHWHRVNRVPYPISQHVNKYKTQSTSIRFNCAQSPEEAAVRRSQVCSYRVLFAWYRGSCPHQCGWKEKINYSFSARVVYRSIKRMEIEFLPEFFTKAQTYHEHRHEIEEETLQHLLWNCPHHRWAVSRRPCQAHLEWPQVWHLIPQTWRESQHQMQRYLSRWGYEKGTVSKKCWLASYQNNHRNRMNASMTTYSLPLPPEWLECCSRYIFHQQPDKQQSRRDCYMSKASA